MKALIVGYGSIGKRHARLLAPMMFEVAVVSSQVVSGYRRYDTLAQALGEFAPDYIVIATITADHAINLETLKLLGFSGQVLVEKPLFASAKQNGAPYPFIVHVAYQLRFHPVIAAMAETLGGRKVLSAHVYVGQHLDSWRTGRDTKSTYSASRAKGGGVLRDLSHELDLIHHLFGGIESSHAIAERVSDLTLDSDDVVAFVMRCKDCPVLSLQMNYIDHVARREWIVNTRDISLRADLIACTLAVNDEIEHVPCEPDDAYRAMHKALLSDHTDQLCSFEEGLRLVELIDTVSL